MPREVWDPDKPSAAFTPKRQPLSVKQTDPFKYMKSPLLGSSTQGIIGRNPHVDSGIRGKPATGITYTEPQATKDLNKAIKKSRDVIPYKKKDDDGGGTKTTVTPDPCGGRGRNPDGSCKEEPTTGGDKCAGKSLVCPSDRPKGQGVCDPATGNVDFSSCAEETSPCTYGKNPDGSCKEKPGDGNGGGTPSLTTINQPDETPMLQTLTSEMDLRNMLSNVLNKNNPLFKQARTRALQAMAARGTVNSSMAEEAVTTAILNVAMPIATRVIDDLQRVMAANVNATNAFKQAVNEAYYRELLLRVEAANTWNLSRMTEAGANWRALMEARGRAADTSDPKVFERYMDMLGGVPGFHLGTPTYDIAGT